MKKIVSFLQQHKLITGLILLGVVVRLIFIFFFNHMIDFMNILAVSKSVAETGNVTGGILAVSKLMHSPQLYGKIYYQVAALWLFFLEKLKILQIQFLFDTKPYTGLSSYLVGLGQWSPPLYQLVSVKLIQFFWDFLFLFFLYQFAKEVGVKKLHYVILFWALNPFFLLITYAVFMPEIAMMMCTLGGTLFWIRALRKKTRTFFDFNVLVSLGFFALGAVIKQVPILFIPFVLISCSESALSLIIYSLCAGLSYILFSQPWAADASFIKQFSLFSNESLSIFKFTLNGLPVFILLYGLLLLYALSHKSKVFSSHVKILVLIISTFCIVYVCDTLFFIQFLIWILPFAALLALIDPSTIWIMALSFVGVFIKAIASSDYFSILLSPAIGSMYSDYLTNSEFLKNIINTDFYNLVLYSVNVFIYIVIGLASISHLLERKSSLTEWFSQHIHISFTKLVILCFVFYFIFVAADFCIKSRYILLPQYNYQQTGNQIALSQKPISVIVNNPQKTTITALEIPIMTKGSLQPDTTTFVFKSGNSVVDEENVSDYTLPTNSDNPYQLFLHHAVNAQSFEVKIYKKNNINSVSVFESKILNDVNVPHNGLYKGYDTPNPDEMLMLTYPNQNFAVAFRGIYGTNDIMNAFKFNLRTKRHRIFFGAYLAVTTLLFIVSVYFLKSRRT